MASKEATGIGDVVQADLVDCAPVPDPVTPMPLMSHQDASPTQQAMQATLAQTGAGPPPDIGQGCSFLLIYADGSHLRGDSFSSWTDAPSRDLLICDVYVSQCFGGRPGRWRMQCDWFGCQLRPDGLWFWRWHDAVHDPTDRSWAWKRGVLVSDAAMALTRQRADQWR